ncbi:BBE domain-containing protein [Bradyrhizobium sp. B117]|uniref:BBE domain-containing protein n=1 Tax=Bradyrhizobium sp. B117 TaxID=3140246 RepID=UPI003183297E
MFAMPISSPQMTRIFGLRPGAVASADDAAVGAFIGLRRDHVLIEIIASCPDRSDGSEKPRHRDWVRDTRRAFDPVALPGGYPNLLGPDGVDRAAKCFGTNVERLARVRQLYDPENVFCSAIPLPIGCRPVAVE